MKLGTERPWIEELHRNATESDKAWSTVLLVSVCFGLFGIDRLYLGYTFLAFLKFFTLGCFGIWWLIDILIIATGKMRDADGRTIKRKN